MYTVDTFLTDGAFTLMRPMFVALLVFAVIMLVLVLMPFTRKRLLNAFSVIAVTLILCVASIQGIYYDAIIVDELGLGGDATTTSLVAATLIISFVSAAIYFVIRSAQRPSKA